MGTAAFDVHPATLDRWDDVVDLFGTRGDAARCWCQWFRKYGSTEANREALHDELAADPPQGVIAYDQSQAVGWLRICPVGRLPKIANSAMAKQVRSITNPELDHVWHAACFVVKVGHRLQGVADALLRGGVKMAQSHGARTIIARPIDTEAPDRPRGSGGLFAGVLSTFLGQGFTEVARYSSHRVLVKRSIG